MNQPNPELRLAEEFVQHTDCHIFLTGKAGTGKTTFLQAIQKRTPKRMVVTAPTGVAAINAGGVTLHSFFQLPFGPNVPGSDTHLRQHRVRREKKNVMRSMDLLVIDEISMVRADLLDGVDSVLRRYRRSDQPFGGVQLLMIGDLYQLSPVAKPAEWQLLRDYYDSPYFFSSRALKRTELIPIELQHIYRQTDRHFIDLLNRVRGNTLDPSTLQRLNSRYQPDFSTCDAEGTITLCTHNHSADAINQSRLKDLPGSIRRFHAEQAGDFPEHAFPASATLEVKPGAQVMFVRNDPSPGKYYFNGKIGTITGISGDAITVRCPEDTDVITVEKTTWENIEYTVDPQTAEISQKVIGTFSQYPLKLAWAITIHKSQGLTFDRAVIDAQAAFAHGQVYVALSRCRTFEGMVLSTPLTPQAVKTDPVIKRFASEMNDLGPTAETFAVAKSRYQRRLMLECFDFGRLGWLLGRLANLLRVNAALIQVSNAGDMDAVRQQVPDKICSVGEKFKRQLDSMFSPSTPPGADPAILERLTKASAYFEDKLVGILLPCLENLVIETDNKEIRKKLNDAARLLKEEAAVKLAAVRSCRNDFSSEHYLHAISAAVLETGPAKKKTPAVLYSEKDVGHPELFEILRQWRKNKAEEEGVANFQVLHQKTLVQIAVHLPDSIEALKKVKGIGDRLAERYGREITAMVADYRRTHGIVEVALPEPSAAAPPAQKPASKAPKPADTRKASLELFQQGLTIDQIAGRRSLVTSTIEGHLAHFVANGELEIGRVVPAARLRAMEEKLSGMRSQPLKKIKQTLGGEYSYGEIQMVLAHLKRNE
jgi:hypothetical protein